MIAAIVEPGSLLLVGRSDREVWLKQALQAISINCSKLKRLEPGLPEFLNRSQKMWDISECNSSGQEGDSMKEMHKTAPPTVHRPDLSGTNRRIDVKGDRYPPLRRKEITIVHDMEAEVKAIAEITTAQRAGTARKKVRI